MGDWHGPERDASRRRNGACRHPGVARAAWGRGDTNPVRWQRQSEERRRAAGRAGVGRRAGRRSVTRSTSLGRTCAHRRGLGILPRMYGFLVIVLILDSLILTTAVLLQAGQGGGLATMGGGAGTETIMGGRQATTLLTKVTWWTAGIFLFLALVLTFMSQSGTQVRSVLEGQGQSPTPVAPTPLPLETQPTAPPAPPPQPPSNRRP